MTDVVLRAPRPANADVLRLLIRRHKLSRARVAELCGGVSIHTVHGWLLPATSKAHRGMPNLALLVLQLKLQTRAV